MSWYLGNLNHTWKSSQERWKKNKILTPFDSWVRSKKETPHEFKSNSIHPTWRGRGSKQILEFSRLNFISHSQYSHYCMYYTELSIKELQNMFQEYEIIVYFYFLGLIRGNLIFFRLAVGRTTVRKKEKKSEVCWSRMVNGKQGSGSA